jgi:hypothetical protein
MTPLRRPTLLLLLFLAGPVGCGPTIKPEPDAKARLSKLLRLYQKYVEKNKKGPPDEAALREFGQKLTPQEREESLLDDDLESIWTSPRDGQKYVVEYNLKLDPGAKVRAVAWEATTGHNGKRYVALSRGYVEEYSDLMFNEYRK